MREHPVEARHRGEFGGRFLEFGVVGRFRLMAPEPPIPISWGRLVASDKIRATRNNHPCNDETRSGTHKASYKTVQKGKSKLLGSVVQEPCSDATDWGRYLRHDTDLRHRFGNCRVYPEPLRLCMDSCGEKVRIKDHPSLRCEFAKILREGEW
ncbi:hypothetical protein BC830DRAFT_715857 [Chytriomyces sp. MP71]|nr:hypothetical protein BC830DRAFT_715857 [Chytriomyces sp. MP71]